MATMSVVAPRRARTSRALLDLGIRHWPLVAGLLMAETARIVFWAVTGRRYEDALITLTHAENAANGLGFIHHPQEGHVQGFTSALSALIPLAGEVVHRGAGMATIQTVSLLAAAAAIVYAYLIARKLGVATWPCLFLVSYLALDYNQIIYAMGGMETQIAVAVLLAGAFHVMRRDVVPAGILLGLAVLARPDFILWVVPALAWLVIQERRETGGKAPDALRTGLIAGAVLAPWIIFTALYYGTVVPHTLIAKSTGFAQLPGLGAGPSGWLDYFRQALAQHPQEWTIYAPFVDYAFDETAPGWWWLGNVALVMIVLALAGLWFSRRNKLLQPLLVYGLVFYAYDLLVKGVHYFPWYLPPFMAIVALLVAIGLTRLQDYLPRLGAVLAGALAVAFALPLLWYIPLERTVQRIDDSVRTKVGLYVQDHVRPGESLTSESSGYIGYYGRGVELWDFPGLTSPTSEEALRTIPRGKRDLTHLIAELRPNWLTLRTPELEELQRIFPKVASGYEVKAHFAISPEKTPLTSHGVRWLNIDREFWVLKRRPGALLQPTG
jgi:hypothetical protein